MKAKPEIVIPESEQQKQQSADTPTNDDSKTMSKAQKKKFKEKKTKFITSVKDMLGKPMDEESAAGLAEKWIGIVDLNKDGQPWNENVRKEFSGTGGYMMACGASKEEEEAACGRPDGYKGCYGLRTYVGPDEEAVKQTIHEEVFELYARALGQVFPP